MVQYATTLARRGTTHITSVLSKEHPIRDETRLLTHTHTHTHARARTLRSTLLIRTACTALMASATRADKRRYEDLGSDGFSNPRWHIHFQGGGWGVGFNALVARTKQRLGSSTYWPPTSSYLNGAGSNDPAVSPYVITTPTHTRNTAPQIKSTQISFSLAS